LDEGGSVDVVYLDFAKAFDTVPHRRLEEKLLAYGIQGNILSWITNFLSGRMQRVVVNGKKSEWADVLSGIPQGSVLGPILFVLFINDLPDAIQGTAKLFADDTKVFTQVLNSEDCERLQGDLSRLCQWLEQWLLRFNASKCKVLHLGRANPQHQYTMTDAAGNESVVTEVVEEKDLGVTFDTTLKFSKHISLITNTANKVVGAIRRGFSFMDQDMFCRLYKALVRPHLEYANCVWCPVLKRDKELLERVQRRATKLVPGLTDLSYSDRLRALNLPTLVYRRKRGDMIETYKILNGFEDIRSDSLFTRASYLATRGHNQKLFKKDSRLQVRQHFFTNRVITDWNSLPAPVVCAKNVIEFKVALDCYWESHPARYDYKFEW
jgi:hypothetical protein